METTNICELNSTLKNSSTNMGFINYQQILFNTLQKDLDYSYSESFKEETVCYDSICESKTKIKFLLRIKKDLQR